MKKQTWKMHFYKGVPCTWEHEPYDEERENYTFEADLYIKNYGGGYFISSNLPLSVARKE